MFRPEIRNKSLLSRTGAVRSPSIDIDSVGAGGSIVRIDVGGGVASGWQTRAPIRAPRHGRAARAPRSTDCNLVLGQPSDPG